MEGRYYKYNITDLIREVKLILDRAASFQLGDLADTSATTNWTRVVSMGRRNTFLKFTRRSLKT